MKLFKQAFLSILFLGLLSACSSDDSSLEQENADEQPESITDDELQSSLALRFTLEEMKASLETGSSANTTHTNDDELCFQFDYPIILGFSDDSEMTINDYEALLNKLLSETPADHITSIGFPFDVTLQDGTTQTITDESGFQALVQNCDYDNFAVTDVVALTEDCFEINYPVSLIVNGTSQSFNSQEEAETYFSNNLASIESLNLSYPFSVNLVSDGSMLTINDNFELVDLINNTCGIN